MPVFGLVSFVNSCNSSLLAFLSNGGIVDVNPSGDAYALAFNKSSILLMSFWYCSLRMYAVFLATNNLSFSILKSSGSVKYDVHGFGTKTGNGGIGTS